MVLLHTGSDDGSTSKDQLVLRKRISAVLYRFMNFLLLLRTYKPQLTIPSRVEWVGSETPSEK